MSETGSLSQRALARAKKAISQEYPIFRRVQPDVKAQANGAFTLTFRKNVRLPDGANLRQTLRATVNRQGEVLRVVASR
jgi:hypothetical protein